MLAVKLNGPQRGQMAWRTYTVPTGYSGGVVWGQHSGGRPGARRTVRPHRQKLQLPDRPCLPGLRGLVIGPLAVADGVVFASSMAGAASAPTMLALSAVTVSVRRRPLDGVGAHHQDARPRGMRAPMVTESC